MRPCSVSKGFTFDRFFIGIAAVYTIYLINDLVGIGATYNNIALIYDDQSEYKKALINYLKTYNIFEKLFHSNKEIYQKLNIDNYLVIVFNNIGNDYEKLNKLDSALYYQNKAYALATQIKDVNNIGTVMANLGNINRKLGRDDSALFSNDVATNHQPRGDDCVSSGIAGPYVFRQRPFYAGIDLRRHVAKELALNYHDFGVVADDTGCSDQHQQAS